MNSSKKRVLGGVICLGISSTMLLIAAPSAVATPQARTITTLECKITEDDFGADDIYLQRVGGGGEIIWGPTEINDGESRTVGVAVNDGDTFKVMEDDYPDGDDDLGTFTVQAGVTSYGINKDDAIYNVLVS